MTLCVMCVPPGEEEENEDVIMSLLRAEYGKHVIMSSWALLTMGMLPRWVNNMHVFMMLKEECWWVAPMSR